MPQSRLTLPIELVELILSHLSNDRATLKSCTLVCRAWIPDARRTLFHTIKIDEHTDYRQVLDILKRSPGIRSCIKNLNLKIFNDYRRVPETDRDDVYSFLCDYAPDSLETLELEIDEDHYESDQGLHSCFITMCDLLTRTTSFATSAVHVSRPSPQFENLRRTRILVGSQAIV